MTQPLIVSDEMLDALNATRPWVKFLAILGFVFTGLSVLFGLAALIGLYGRFLKPGLPAFVGPASGVFYLVMALFLYLIPSIYLYRYAKVIAGLPASAGEAFENALRLQKSFWKYVGIFTVILLILYALVIVGFMVAVMYAGAFHH